MRCVGAAKDESEEVGSPTKMYGDGPVRGTKGTFFLKPKMLAMLWHDRPSMEGALMMVGGEIEGKAFGQVRFTRFSPSSLFLLESRVGHRLALSIGARS